VSAALPGQASIQMHSYDIAIKILALARASFFQNAQVFELTSQYVA